MTKTSQNYYIENLSLFTHELRKKGIYSGIKETMDAAKVIEVIGLKDRENLKIALCSIFAKSKRQQHLFFEVFDSFFVGEKVRQQQQERQQEEQIEKEEQYKEAIDELKYDEKPIDLPQEIKDAYANMSKEDREQIMKYINLSTENLRQTPFYEHFFTKTIEKMIRLTDDGDAESPVIPDDINDLLYKNISDITDEEIPQVIRLIQMLVKKINGAISRDYRRSGKKGKLDYRATIHASMKTGGYFHKLIYKKRRRTKKKIVILCDVSGSMVKFTQFALRFIKSMSDVTKSSEIYLFSEEFQKVSPFILENMHNFENHVQECGLLGKCTDISFAIEELIKISSSKLTSSTILLVLSDAKTMNPEAAAKSLKKISRRTDRIIWMNPIPEEKWNKISTISSFRSNSQMLDCSTLNNLARACVKFI